MNSLKTLAVLSLAMSLLGCSNSNNLTRKGSVAWHYNYSNTSGQFQFQCLAASSGQCQTEFLNSSGKALKVVSVEAGHSINVSLPAGATYFSVTPDEGLAILARTTKIQRADVSGSQAFNKDHA